MCEYWEYNILCFCDISLSFKLTYFIIFHGSSAQITDTQAHDALMEFVGQHCCYGKGAAKDMSIKDMKHSSAFHVS